MNVSAYIPCFNNERTIVQAIASIRQQTVPVAELFVVDDGSTDRSMKKLQELGVRVIAHSENLGRGAARARGMTEAQHDLVLACDATLALAPDFLAGSLSWLEQESVAAAFGCVTERASRHATDRWRGRHLFGADTPKQVNRRASLATGGVLMRKSCVLKAGNFDPRIRQGEDAELGERLLARGFEVVFDPGLGMTALGQNTLAELLERYWRWNVGVGRKLSWKIYLRQISYSIKVMARQDLQQSDLAAAAISFLCPHYLFWKANLCKSQPRKN